MISGLLSTMAELLSNAAKYVENMNLLFFFWTYWKITLKKKIFEGNVENKVS